MYITLPGLASNHKEGPLSEKSFSVNKRRFGNSIENSANRVEKQPSSTPDKSKTFKARTPLNETVTGSGQPGLECMDDALLKFLCESPPSRSLPRSPSLLWTTEPADVNDWDFQLGTVPVPEQELDVADAVEDDSIVDDCLPPVNQSLLCDNGSFVDDDYLPPVNQSLLCDNDSDTEVSQK